MNRRCASLLFVLPLTLCAQAPRDVAPLKYWPAPLYWQPTQAESRMAAKSEIFKVTPEIAPPAQTPANSLVFVGMTPCRIADTRAGFGFTGAFGPPMLAGGATRSFPIQTSTTCSIPSNAQAYSLNLTVAPPGQMYYLTIWPFGASQPNASTLNDLLGAVIANAAIVPAGGDAGSGSVNVFVTNNTDLIIDINGYYASQTDLHSNTAIGIGSLVSDTTGFLNTANGVNALHSNTTGSYNTATGWAALGGNTTGIQNTASGALALNSNAYGGNNTATGYGALQFNTSGNSNTASGAYALAGNTTGNNNTASGWQTLHSNTTGYGNTASGVNALAVNTTGNGNTASGINALFGNTTGTNNTATGYDALSGNTTGNNNIAIGYQAGQYITTGSNNVDIANQGSYPLESGIIRIGTPNTQTSFYAAGVRGVTTGNNDAVPVVIDSNGQLGTVSSSARFKEDIHDMADASSGLLRLRPVTYRYKQPYADGSKPIDYGLIAEEVAEVYPDLVVRNADGQVETVQYQKLTPMLLNELQKQAAKSEALAAQQRERLSIQDQQIASQQGLIEKLQDRLAALEAAGAAK